jgi:hypothetical protein
MFCNREGVQLYAHGLYLAMFARVHTDARRSLTLSQLNSAHWTARSIECAVLGMFFFSFLCIILTNQ